MEGLEVSVLKKSAALLDNATLRVDPEYFIKDAVRAYHLLSGQSRFGTMIERGYRVVYENTKVVEREEGIEADLPFFLQSADITTPFINEGTLSCVPEGDWDRYPKGRIVPGELLVEVKGRAEKVAIVPDDFPVRTLVTGTCFKISPISPSHRSLMLAYLMSDHGAVLKNRLKTNLLVSYIAKDDLYRLPFPTIGDPLRLAIHQKVQAALECRKEILGKTAEAEATLLAALGLAGWSPPEPVAYQQAASALVAADRMDAEYFDPRHLYAEEIIGNGRFEKLGTLAQFVSTGPAWPSESFSTPDDPEGIPFVRIRNCKPGDIETATLDRLPPDSVDKFDADMAHAGDLVIGMDGLKYFYAGMMCNNAYVNQRVGWVRMLDSAPPSNFVQLVINSPLGQAQLLRRMTIANTVGHITLAHIRDISIPIIPEAGQNMISSLLVQASQTKGRSRALLSSAKRAVEIAIEDGEAAALTHLERAAG